MKEAVIRIYTRQEWIDIVTDFYENYMDDMIKESLQQPHLGGCLPKEIWEKGIKGLDDDDLIEVMEGYIESVMDNELGKDGLFACYFIGLNGRMMQIASLDEVASQNDLNEFMSKILSK